MVTMKVFRRCQLLAVLGFIGTALAVVPLSSVPRVTSSDVVPGQFIVEVSSSSDIPSTKRGLSSVSALLVKPLPSVYSA